MMTTMMTACAGSGHDTSLESENTRNACMDGEDNDADGLTGFPTGAGSQQQGQGTEGGSGTGHENGPEAQAAGLHQVVQSLKFEGGEFQALPDIVDHGQVIGSGRPSEIVRNEAVRQHYLGDIFEGDEFDDKRRAVE